MDTNLDDVIASLKGIPGTGGVLEQSIKNAKDFLRTLEPGDIVRRNPPLTIAAPIAYDIWYLNCHANMMRKYFDQKDGTPVSTEKSQAADDWNHYKYSAYLSDSLGFLSILPGLKPLKVVRDLAQQLDSSTSFDVASMRWVTEWANNGVFWINTMAFELQPKGRPIQYPSVGPKQFTTNPSSINDYVGYLTFPVGQLGVQEVISLIQETKLSGYKVAALDDLPDYYTQAEVTVQEIDKPKLQTPPEIFPDMKDGSGNTLAGMNYCYGRHLIESAYLTPTIPAPAHNTDAPAGETVRAAILDVELFSTHMEKYQEDVRPKFWMRYWIHRDSTLPVPGEFIGILCRPVAAPPHVWWFQESSPFLYAGNWMETGNMTSGVIVAVTLEADRTDDGIGNQYRVRIQGCEILVNASDFLSYSSGDRVAILKVDSTVAPAETSITWRDQKHFKDTDKDEKMTNYVIIPATFYKKMP